MRRSVPRDCRILAALDFPKHLSRALARSGAAVAHNPVCNLRLGSGIAPFRRWRNAGVSVCIGTDEILADDLAITRLLNS